MTGVVGGEEGGEGGEEFAFYLGVGGLRGL